MLNRILVLVLTLFLSAGVAAACVGTDEHEIELSHPTDGSLYFVPVHNDFSKLSTEHGVTTYSKATTRLAFKTSSFTTSGFSDTKVAAKIVLSEYNNQDKYKKVVELTAGTTPQFTSYYIEFNDTETNDKGIVTAIIGQAYDEKTKVYIIELRAKDARYAQEKEAYQKMLDNFSVSALEECPASNEQASDNQDNPDNASPNDSGTQDGTLSGTQEQQDNGAGANQTGSESNSGTLDNSVTGNSITNQNSATQQNSGNQNQPQEPFKIFGFDGWVVIAAVVLLILLLAAGFVGLVIVAVVVYFFFIKKKR